MPKVSGAVYVGKCELCGTVYESQFLVKVETKKVIPPPIIKVSCQCRHPVNGLDMIYFKGIES